MSSDLNFFKSLVSFSISFSCFSIVSSYSVINFLILSISSFVKSTSFSSLDEDESDDDFLFLAALPSSLASLFPSSLVSASFPSSFFYESLLLPKKNR